MEKTAETYRICEFYHIEHVTRKPIQKSVSLELEIDYMTRSYKLKNISEIPITEASSQAVQKLLTVANNLGLEILKLKTHENMP